MSRIAKNPITVPKDVEAKLDGQLLTITGKKGILTSKLHQKVNIGFEDGLIRVLFDKSDREVNSLSGTTRAIINNMVTGVSAGFEKKLVLIGVGYRAQAKNNILSLSLGFSHPIEYEVPNGIVIETPTQTEIVIKGSDKQIVGQVAANIRSYRPPEPYKGKGIRYSDEVIVRKEAKKK
jgi:large subunit ribosomal protein L6